MGYDVHITRKLKRSDDSGPRIQLAEWIALVEADPEMRLDGFAETRVGGGAILRIKGEGLSVWTAYSRHDENGPKAWFNFWEGKIRVKNPDTEILRKMWSLAQALAANVQGDGGELYDASGQQLPIQRDRI
jgi:hypothetical protein